jgi:hypothetical protein
MRAAAPRSYGLAEKAVDDDVSKHPDHAGGGPPRPPHTCPPHHPSRHPAPEPLAPKPSPSVGKLGIAACFRCSQLLRCKVNQRSESVGGCPRYYWSRKARRGSLAEEPRQRPLIRRCVAMCGSPRRSEVGAEEVETGCLDSVYVWPWGARQYCPHPPQTRRRKDSRTRSGALLYKLDRREPRSRARR